MKTNSLKFAGVCPAIVTPYDKEGRFCPDAFAKVADYLYEKGSRGLYVAGLTGEAYCLAHGERKVIAETAVSVSRGRGYVIQNVGTQDTASACDLAAHAAEAGVDAIASIPPINRPFSEILSYYRDLAQAGGGVPVFIYHIPPYTHLSLSTVQFLKLLDIPHVVGLKFTDYNVHFMHEIISRKPDTLVFYGRDEQFLAGMMFGAVGGIGSTYNIFPDLYLKVERMYRAGKWRQAMAAQVIAAKMLSFLYQAGLQSVIQAWFQELGLVHRCFRAPIAELSGSKRKDCLKFLRSIQSQV